MISLMILIWVRISGLVRQVARNSASGVPISPAANNHRFGHVKFHIYLRGQTKYGGRN
jgi:hypothetical protein